MPFISSACTSAVLPTVFACCMGLFIQLKLVDVGSLNELAWEPKTAAESEGMGKQQVQTIQKPLVLF